MPSGRLAVARSEYGTLRQRKERRQQGAMVRAETYSKLTLDEKINEQEPFKGKQYKKLLARKEA
jgi:hypothetical protein